MTKMPLGLTNMQSIAVCNQKLVQAVPEHLSRKCCQKGSAQNRHAQGRNDRKTDEDKYSDRKIAEDKCSDMKIAEDRCSDGKIVDETCSDRKIAVI